MKNQGNSKVGIFLAMFVIMVVGAILTSVTLRLEDRRMRGEFLVQARMLEKGINAKQILGLSGSEADLDSLDYQYLKEQLVRGRSANPQCRFTYLMGQRPSGDIFFFADSEPQDSKDYSPPGQVFTEISQPLLNVFLIRKEAVEGPISDRWGKWVSALVPVINPRTGKIIAVLGMDIDARNWGMHIIYHSLAPVAITLLILIVAATILFVQRKKEREKMNVASAKLALWNSEENFRQLFENMGDGVAIYQAVDEGRDFVFKNLNKMGEKISQIKRENVIGRRVTEIFPAVAEIGLLEALYQVWRTGESYYLPGVLYKDKRIEHWSENYILKLSSGLIVVVYSDITKRKQVEVEIINMARFPSENPEPVLRIDKNGKLLFVNQAGFSKLANFNLQIGQLVPSVFQDLVLRSLESGLIQRSDIKYGQQVYSFHVTPIITSGYVNLYGNDITDLKQTENKLLEYAQRMSFLTKYANDFIMLLDDNFNLLEVNERAQEFYGYTYDELIGMHASKLRAPETRGIFNEQISAIKTVDRYVYETLHQRKDGSIFPVEISLRAFSIEGKKFYQAIIRDITEGKRIKDELNRKTEILEAQKEASLDGLLVVDEAGQRILINKRLLELWKVPTHIAEDKNDEALLQYVVSKIKDPQQFLDKVNYLYAHRDEKSRDEVEFKDGTIFDRYSSPVIDKNGNYFGRIWTFRDITELKQAEQELKKDLHDLEVFYKASINREERILELKKQLKDLERKLGNLK